MYNPSSHPQVKYSLEAMSQGLFFYLQTDPLEKITISQICAQAGVTRRTFYRNCEKKEDLILYACDRLIDTLLETVDFTSEDARQLYLNFFRYWGQHKPFLRCVVNYNLYGMFVERFVQTCSQRMRFPLQEHAFCKKTDADQYRFFSDSFLLGGLSRMLHAWAEDDFRLSEEDLTESILFLVPENAETVTKQ